MLWFNYVASFSDGVQKVGVTSQPFYRLQEHVLEAARHDLRINGFYLTGPSVSKQVALKIKRHVSEMNSCWAVDEHENWFAQRDEVDRRPLPAPDFLFDYIQHGLKEQWDLLNPILHQVRAIVTYSEMREFAMELGTSGLSIKPAAATAIADRLARDHDKTRRARTAKRKAWEHLPPDQANNAWLLDRALEKTLRAARIQSVAA